MNDLSSSAKDAPKTFSERGVSVPFTSSELLWARVRQNGEVKELLVPGLAKTRGIFVYEWSTMRNRFALSLQDRLLAKEIASGPPPTPDRVGAAGLRLTGSGAAGAAAKTATGARVQQAKALSQHLRLHVAQRIADRLGRKAQTLSIDDLGSPEGLRKVTDALSEAAQVYGLSGPTFYNRIESLAAMRAPVGLAGLPIEAPNRRLAQRRTQLARTLAAWAEAGARDGDVEARLVSRVAAEAARLATAGLAKIDTDTQGLELLLTEWDERAPVLRAETERIHWILDGWARFLRLWQNVAKTGPQAQSQALILMSYAMPMIPTAELRADERAAWEEMNAELTKVIAAHQDGIDLKTALDLLGPESEQPLADLAAPSAAPPRRRGLSAEKLSQIVRILEPASDRADGTPAKTMLAELRPQIAQLRPGRVPRARRVICDVFEELLIDGETSGRIASRIPRSAIMPAWALFLDRVDKDRFAALEKKLDQPENVAALWQLFVNAVQPDLDDAASFTSKSRMLIVRLGGEAHYHALENMVGAISVAQLLAQLRAALPPAPIGEFSDADLDKIAPILNDVRNANPSQIQTALSIIMTRMAEPWAISKLLEMLAATGRFRSSAGIAGFVATAMIGQLEGRVQDVRRLVEGPGADVSPEGIGEAATTLVDSIAQCAQTIAGTTASLAVSGTPGQVEDVAALREKISALVAANMGRSGAASLLAAFTGAPAVRGDNGALRPGARWRFDQPLDAATLRNAELYARALRRAQESAAVLGLGDKLSAGLKQTVEEFEKVVGVLFGQMRTAQLDRVQREDARNHVAGIAHVFEILTDSERAERLLGKGHEAVG